ncbi:hypothetical protein STTU_4929 [Streptomyces sp. Tu6071]|uniref:hypothetical protein n=1 Tax=Streptomyces sp. Tu6071 TaxID=355249 RepID=UPI00020E6005|nr:hypothetical protein [Streptomyces sp. Tu6071]EGJ77718.1 hypothetical protein STTU_4929 [Streptomyces sp. Tu6071]
MTEPRPAAPCSWPTCLPEAEQQALVDEITREERGEGTDAVLAVLPASATPVDPVERRTRYAEVREERNRLRATRAAVLREAADHLARQADELWAPGRTAHTTMHADATELRRLADEAQQAEPASELQTLAAALDGLHTLIATSSRDWQTYRVDAWIWALLCGWDCEKTEHDDACTHGALEETAEQHGWDDATVAKARRYRAAIRSLTGETPGGGR